MFCASFRPSLLLVISLALSIVLQTGCGSDDSSCNAANCPSGCCNPQGVCQTPGLTACGVAGAACAAWTTCGAGFTCNYQLGTCMAGTCAPGKCSGCCSGGTCIPAATKAQCGANGSQCKSCTGTQECINGVCADKPCDSSCPGCCFNGVCQPGDQPGACGKGGEQCNQCASNQCVDRQCNDDSCSASKPCAIGCCDSAGKCQPGTIALNCGTTGSQCTVCGQNQVCSLGQCTDVAQGCSQSCTDGCCDGNTCVKYAGQDETKCGTAGEACGGCASNQVCDKTLGKCTCTAQSCQGCCDGDNCRAGNHESACGTGGQACAPCTGNDLCIGGTCKYECNFISCTGCCEGTSCNLSGSGDAAACGIGGNSCTQCNAGEICTDGTCNNGTQCSATAGGCSAGCCKDSACVAGGGSASGCGKNGDVCIDCADYQYCSNNQCVANPTSTWDVTIAEVKINPSTDWDEFLEGDAKPDTYVELTLGGVTKKTKAIKDSYNPIYNAYLMTVTAQSITALNAVSYKIFDEDTWTADDKIAECSHTITASQLEAGGVTLPGCNSYVTSVRLEFKVRTAQ